jgi:hypothetical protein
LHKAFSDAGRDPSTAEVIPFGTDPTPDKLDYYESIGVKEVVAALPYAGIEDVLPVLDTWAKAYPRFLA